MPCYNPKNTIFQAINSVLNQTYPDIELWIVDDNSTESKVNLTHILKDERIKFVQLPYNQGPAAARNQALRQTDARYVAFLDCDDWWEPTKIEKQLVQLMTSSVALSYCAYELVNEQGEWLQKTIQVPKCIRYTDLLKNTIIGCLTVVVDRKKTGLFLMPEINGGEDTATWLNLLKKNHTAMGIQEPLAYYRVQKKSYSANKFVMAKNTWKMYGKTQELSFVARCYYFTNYAINAVKKRM